MAKINLDINLDNGETLQLGNKDILSVESLSQSNGQPKGIFYGVTPNSGSAKINDNNGNFAKMIQNGTIKNSNMPISVFANGNKVQEHLTTDSDYDNNGRVFSMQFENELSKWDSFQYGGFELNTDNGGNPIPDNAYNMLVSVLTNEYVGYTPSEVDNMLTTQIVYGANNTISTVKEYLQSITINAPYLASGSLRETIEKFCLLAQLNVYEDNNGKIKFVSARPKRVGNEPILVIPPKKQFSVLTKDIILKNKFDGVEFSAKQLAISNSNDVYNLVGIIINSSQLVIETNSNNTYYLSTASGEERKTTNNPLSYTYQAASWIDKKQFVGSQGFYYVGNIIIPKRQNLGLEKVIQINNAIDSLERSINYNKITYTATSTKKSGIPQFNEITLTETDTETSNGEIENVFNVNKYLENDGNTRVYFNAKIELNNSNGYINYTEDNQFYYVSYKVLIGRRDYFMQQNILHDPEDIGNWNGTCTYFKPTMLDLGFSGNKQIISFEDLQKPSDKSAETVVSLHGNELTQTPNDVNGIENTIINNIKNDYANGISTATVTVSCSNYKDTNGNVIKRWENGEIINVGDIVRLDKDNNGNSAFCYENGSQILWKVTGRTFRNEGIPFCDLELQEIL